MPKAKLPHNLKGWLAAIVSSLVGFVAGLLALEVLHRWFGP